MQENITHTPEHVFGEHTIKNGRKKAIGLPQKEDKCFLKAE